MTKDEQLKALCVELFAPKPRENSIRIWEESNAEKFCKEPLVSVCIATYNHERWIAEALDSVLCQACDFPYEVIIGEDCSSDRTREICRDYQSRFPDKVRVLCAERNTQCVEISQAVRVACRGTYLAFLEGDDYWCDALKLQGQVKRLKETGADVCFGRTALVSIDGTFLNRPLFGDSSHWTAADGANHLRVAGKLPHISSWLVLCKFWNQLSNSYPVFVFRYDTQCVAVMCAEGHAVSVDKIVSCYRITGEGIWTSLSNAKAQWMRLAQYAPVWAWMPSSKRTRELRRATLTACLYVIKEAEITREGRQQVECAMKIGRLVYPWWHFLTRIRLRKRYIRAIRKNIIN